MSMLAATLLAFTSSAASMPDPVIFTVFRQGKPFGYHSVSFRRDGASLIADIRISLSVMLGPITLFSYGHSCTERWEASALQSINCTTEKDGKSLRLSGQRQGGEFVVNGTEFRGAIGSDVLPSSYWHGFPLNRSAMINSETGKVLPMTLTPIGKKVVPTIDGVSITSECYRLSSDIELTLCYDDQDRWVWTSFEARGQSIEYRLHTKRAE
jgi:hypothetical protein